MLAGWWYTYPSEKYEIQLGSLVSWLVIWKNKTCSKPPISKLATG
jgi:hypothetical protein